MGYIVLIPAYKPSEKLVELIDELNADNIRTLVVNDGSGSEYDAIFDKVRERGIEVVVHDVNMGKGMALKTGIERISKMDDVDGIVTADADGQHLEKDIIRIMDSMRKHPDSLILGVRQFAKSNVPFRSRLGNWVTKCLFFLVARLRISDTQTGLRGLPRSIFGHLIELEGSRYEYEMSMLLSVRHWGVSVVQVPIETVYIDGNKGSSFNTFKDTFAIAKQLLKFSVSSLISTLVDYGIYMALGFIFPQLAYAARFIPARVASATCNYLLNRLVVFKKGTTSSVFKYILLASCVMLVSALCVNCLEHLGLGSFLSKVLIDAPMFFVNYYFQKEFVFKKK